LLSNLALNIQSVIIFVGEKMAQPQRRPSLDSDVEEDPERGKKVRIKVLLIKSSYGLFL
jgi:hypothetical protein